MTFELVKGSGNSVMSTVHIDERRADAQLWWCEGKKEWHWCLIWEDGSPYGTHMHNGAAPARMKARADIVRTMIWIEDMWPTHEYFDFAY